MAISIRKRYRLPKLDYTKLLNDRHCRFDLVRLGFKNFTLKTGPTFNPFAFTQLLAINELCVRSGPSVLKLTFKKHWLFGGTINLRQVGNAYIINIQLDLNLSRFLSLCEYSIDVWNSTPPEQLLRTNPDLENARRLSTFNDASNMLTSEQWARSDDQEDLFLHYLTFVQQFIEEQIRYAAQYNKDLDPNRPLLDDDCQLIGDWGDCVIYRTEAYHEFFASDALSTVHALRDKMQVAVSDITERIYNVPKSIQEGHLRWRTRQNALSISCNMERNSIDLIVYVKAPRRIRFEVRYNESLKGLLGHGLALEAASGKGLSSRDVSIVLSKAREDATERLTHFMKVIAEMTSTEAPSMEAFLDLVHEINIACDGDALLMRDLLSILTNNKAVLKPKEANDPLAMAVECLISEKVVERVRIAKRNRTYRYVVVGKYRGSLERVSEALCDNNKT